MLGQITDPLSSAPWKRAAYRASFLGALFHLDLTKPPTCHSQADVLFKTRFSLIIFECPVVKPQLPFLKAKSKAGQSVHRLSFGVTHTEWLKTFRLGNILPLPRAWGDVKCSRPLNRWGRDFLKSDTNAVSPPVDYKTQSETVGISRPAR